MFWQSPEKGRIKREFKKNIMLDFSNNDDVFMLLFIVFGENGLTDLYRLKIEKDQLVEKE